jgi:multiple antibiotic resistance protein
MILPLKIQIFTFLFLMLGPFKIVGPFTKITKNATPAFSRRIAYLATLYSTVALLIAGLLGERILRNYGIPLPILALSGGLILFLVALLNIIKQFEPPHQDKIDFVTEPTMAMAMNPLAFPAIVTPYGIAAVIVFLSIAPDLNYKLIVAGVVLGIMILNLIVMLLTRLIFKPLALILGLLGAVLGIVQVALGLMIIFNQVKALIIL